MRLPRSIPRRMPTAFVLQHLAMPAPPSAFLPFKTVCDDLRPPRVSLRNQARIRKAAILAGIDPASINLPPLEQPADDRLFVLPKGDKREIRAIERQKKIDERLAGMPQRMAQWREERKKAREAKRPDMPF